MTVRPPRRIRRLGHLALAVPDVGRAVDFYTRVVGLAEVERAGGIAYLRAQFEHHCLELHPLFDPAAGRAEPLHIGWETDGDEDTEELRAVLTRAGVPLRPAPAEPGRLGIAFQFQDLLGMWNEVYRTTQRVAAALPAGGLPSLRLAHCTRMTPDPDADAAFYQAIGFRISDVVPGVQSFLRCGSEHHSAGFLKFDRPLLHHHAYEIGSWEAIKVVLDHVMREGWKVETGPVRHAAGNNIAVYVRDPDAVRVEFFCEMDQIGDDEDHDTRRQPVIFDLWHQSAPPPGFRD
jgi:catechol 2,3-dioxygenase-like lactoylglutathione lyase family enzyme